MSCRVHTLTIDGENAGQELAAQLLADVQVGIADVLPQVEGRCRHERSIIWRCSLPVTASRRGC